MQYRAWTAVQTQGSATARGTPLNVAWCLRELRGCCCCLAGKKDGLCPYSAAVAAAAKAPRATLISLDAGHFDPYVQPTLGQSLQQQLRFLKNYVAQA